MVGTGIELVGGELLGGGWENLRYSNRCTCGNDGGRSGGQEVGLGPGSVSLPALRG
jgi:hypothetical protein